MNERQKGAKSCPKCGSSNITFAAFFKPSIWRCLDCGYEGAFVDENDQPVKRLYKEIRNQQLFKIPDFQDSTSTLSTASPANG